MKKIIVFLLVLAPLSQGNAQNPWSIFEHPSQVWHTGQVLLNDGGLVKGLIKYDLASDAVHFDLDGTTRTYVANQITRFSFFQLSIKANRHFIALPFSEKGDYKRPKLFEIIYEAETSLLAREETLYSNWTKLDPDGIDGIKRTRFNGYNYDYFLVEQDEEIKTMNKGVKGMTRSFNKHHEALRSFIKRNKISIKEVGDVVNLVGYYNTLD